MTIHKLTAAEKVAIYRAGKAVYDAPGGHDLAPKTLFEKAARGILSPTQRDYSKSYCYTLETLCKGELPKSIATKTIQWWPPEWDFVVPIYTQAIAEGKSKREAAQLANRSLPKSRQRNDTSQVFSGELMRMEKALRQYDKPTAASPFIAAPTPPVVPEPEPQTQAPPVETSVNLANVGPAISVALSGLLTTMGEAIGRELGKHIESAVKSIGDKMQASLAETMYQMRMGLLTGRQPPAPQTVQPGNPLPPMKFEPPKLAGNGYTGRKRVLIIGLLPAQEQMIQAENTHLDFKFMSREAPGDRIKHVAENCDATYVMLNFVSHSVTDALRKQNGGPGYAGVKGVMEAITLRLRDDFPRPGVTRETPRKEAEAYAAQH